MFRSIVSFHLHPSSSPSPISGVEQVQLTISKSVHILEQNENLLTRDIVYSLLQECIKNKDIIAGRTIYFLMIYKNLDSVGCFGDHLIRLFTACGCLPEADHVFANIKCRKTLTWNAIISAHVNLGESRRALDLYHKMQQTGYVVPDAVTLVYTLKACSSVGYLEYGRLIHAYVVERALEDNIIVMNTVIDMYAKCNSVNDAFLIFDGLLKHTVVSWAAMISGYVQEGHNTNALQLFEKMQERALEPNESILLMVLKACAAIGSTVEGMKVHDQIIKRKFESQVCIISMLVDMYSKCGSLDEAHALFMKASNVDLVTWTTMITGYTENGYFHQALMVFKEMQRKGVTPNPAILYSVLKACSGLSDLAQGIRVHDEIRGTDIERDLVVRTGLVEMYTNCGRFDQALELLDDSFECDHVLLEAMINGCVKHGHNEKAIEIFEMMPQRGLQVRTETYMVLLKASGAVASSIGWLMHDQIIKSGCELDPVVASALVNMYAKNGNFDEAHHVFYCQHDQTVMCWGGMIAGYVQHGYDFSALALFSSMLKDGICPDRATLSFLLKACGKLGTLKVGWKVHDLVLKNSYESDSVLVSSLLDMYAQCGSLNAACKVFDSAADRDDALWGAIIASCSHHGKLPLAVQYLIDMQNWGHYPGNMIFTSILTGCCSSGALEEGHQVFKVMREQYDILPDKEHCSCMIDMLSRAGFLHEAFALLSLIPSKPDIIMWTSVLTGCKMYGVPGIGNQCFQKFLELYPEGCLDV